MIVLDSSTSKMARRNCVSSSPSSAPASITQAVPQHQLCPPAALPNCPNLKAPLSNQTPVANVHNASRNSPRQTVAISDLTKGVFHERTVDCPQRMTLVCIRIATRLFRAKHHGRRVILL